MISFSALPKVVLAVSLVSTVADTCSYSVGNSTINFKDVTTVWNITSLVCDGVTQNKTFSVNDTGFGSCARVGTSDYDNYWKFQMGVLCYPAFSQLLYAKANVTISNPAPR